ncbi:MAG: hypothetical protein BWY98_01105 [Tenericutes bacterium ADurb.BinA155]|nr:MAG: hypothetical protein BWY98_01105 [Tenericutes bacterium ADurb.BinA155]
MIVKDKAGYAGKIYANSGTWIDHNIDGDNSTRTFVKVVSSSNSDEVSLYSYEINGTLTKKA